MIERLVPILATVAISAGCKPTDCAESTPAGTTNWGADMILGEEGEDDNVFLGFAHWEEGSEPTIHVEGDEVLHEAVAEAIDVWNPLLLAASLPVLTLGSDKYDDFKIDPSSELSTMAEGLDPGDIFVTSYHLNIFDTLIDRGYPKLALTQIIREDCASLDISRAMIVVDSDADFRGVDFVKLNEHELGHGVGLDHPTREGLLMSANQAVMPSDANAKTEGVGLICIHDPWQDPETCLDPEFTLEDGTTYVPADHQ